MRCLDFKSSIDHSHYMTTLIFVSYTEFFITFLRWGLTLGAPLYQPAGGYFDDCAKVHSNNNDSIQSTLIIVIIPGALFQLMLLSGPLLLILVRGLACPEITRQPSGIFLLFLRVFFLYWRDCFILLLPNCIIIITFSTGWQLWLGGNVVSACPARFGLGI